MTHVLHVIDALALGGAERMLVEIANQTVRDGHRVTVCVTRSDTRMASSLAPAIEVVVLGRRSRFELAPLVRLRTLVAKADVIHCHGRSSFSLLALLRATRAIAKPVVLHDHLGVQLHPDVPTWMRIARRYLDAYVAVDAAQLAWAERAGIPSARRHVIPNAIDMDELAKRPLVGSPFPVVERALIAVGGIRRDKAIDVLLDAMPLVQTAATLFVVGGDADPAYARACRDRAASLNGRVVFLGERADALALARTATLAVHAARSESGPLVLAEYAALGVPFVATRVGGISARLVEAGVGRFVEPEDPRALARAIDDALAMPDAARTAAIAHASQVARECFTITSAIGAWYDVYERVRT